MHLIILSALRRLISSVDITPSIIRQEYFFSFHYKPYNLCTSHYNQPLKTIPFSCVYLIIPFHFSFFFFHLITPKHYSENSLQVCLSHIHLLFCEFWDGCFPHSIAKFLLYQIHWKPTLSTSEPPILLCRERKNTGFPWIWPITSPYTQGPSKLASSLAHWGG